MSGPDAPAGAVDLERRRISVLAAMAMLGGATIAIGCGGGGGSPSGPSAVPAPPATAPPPTPPAGAANGDKVGTVSDDARHEAVITSAQLSAGGALTLDIKGKAPHGHVIELNAQEVEAVRIGQRVTKLSSTTIEHSHTVWFN